MIDIGKALTHEIEGSHAVIGAYCKEIRRIGNCVECLVHIMVMSLPILFYAHLVAASDAMSGARPGARREMSIDYGKRIEALEKITRKRKHINNCYVIQGRELSGEIHRQRYD